MSKPKPLNLRMVSGWAQLRITGFKDSNSRPYLHLDIGNHGSRAAIRYGYIEDRDIKRLRAWCDDCLKKRRES